MSLARNLLLISDGARWISDIVGADYLKATYQLDWWHYEKKLRAALPGELKLQQELMKLLWEGKREEHRRLLKLKQLVDGPSEKLDDLLGYLEENWDGNLWVEGFKEQDWRQRGPGGGQRWCGKE